MIQDLIVGTIILIVMSGGFVALIVSHVKKLDAHNPRWCRHENDWVYEFDGDDYDNGYLMCDDCGKIMEYASS